MQRLIIKRSVLFIAVIMIAATSLAQQQRVKMAIGYNVATSISESFREYVSKTSFRGLQGSVLYSLNDNFSVGLQVSYNDFYQKYGRQVYKTSDGADISTVLSNTMQNIPVLIKGEYAFIKGNGWIRPYVGLGAGANIIHYDQFLGEFENGKYYTKAAFSGDLGLVVPLCKTSQSAFRLSTSYNFSPFNEAGIKNIDTWNVQAGISFPLK